MYKTFYKILFLSFFILDSCAGKKSDESEIIKQAIRRHKGYEALAFTSYPLKRIEFPESTKARLDSNLQIAKENFRENPVEDNYIWYGRRLAYMMRYTDAMEIFTLGLKNNPNSYRLLRHRGHRFITIRYLQLAINDLKRASELIQGTDDQIEPDGAPNKFNIPLSTDHFNIWYHLGLAYYLDGNFEDAAKAYKECMKVSNNNDLLVATTDWYYMTLRRMGKTEEAEALLEPITEDMEILENASYHKRLMFYKGFYEPNDLLSVDSLTENKEMTLITQRYGVGNWYLYNGRIEEAKYNFDNAVLAKNWAAFGYIASEAEISRMQ